MTSAAWYDTNYQYANDLVLARSLRGVDLIIGGDSHTLLGDFASVGLNSGGPYPTMTTDVMVPSRVYT